MAGISHACTFSEVNGVRGDLLSPEGRVGGEIRFPRLRGGRMVVVEVVVVVIVV